MFKENFKAIKMLLTLFLVNWNNINIGFADYYLKIKYISCIWLGFSY